MPEEGYTPQGLLDYTDLKMIKPGRANPWTGLLNELVDPPVLNQPDYGLITGSERQKNFQRWFEGSKAVDDQGIPKTFYHGTKKQFKGFNTPSFFTNSPLEASVYTGHRESDIGWEPWEVDYDPSKHKIDLNQIEDGGSPQEDWWEPNRIYAVIGDSDYFIEDGKKLHPYDLFYHEDRTDEFGSPVVRKIKGIKVYDETPNISNDEKRRQLIKEGKYWKGFTEKRRNKEKANIDPPKSGNVIPVHLSIKNPKILHPLEANKLGIRLKAMTPEEIKKYIDDLESQGYDGIKTESDIGHSDIDAQLDWGGIPEQYIPFYPGQIKSIFNRGTYDPENPDILSQNRIETGLLQG